MKAQLQKGFDAYRSDRSAEESRGFKPLIDIAVEDYLSRPGNAHAVTMDSDFLQLMTRNMRASFFVGYDSTASSILFCYYALWKHPETLARIRAEHDAVFGADIDSVPRQIVEKPHTLNSLPYTQAVIKETMRLFPVANGLRDGSPDLELVDAKGNTYPTGGFHVVISHYANHMNPRVWKRPEEFIPDRWLVERGHELYPPPKAWRPFAQVPEPVPASSRCLRRSRPCWPVLCASSTFKSAMPRWTRARSSRTCGEWPAIDRT